MATAKQPEEDGGSEWLERIPFSFISVGMDESGEAPWAQVDMT